MKDKFNDEDVQECLLKDMPEGFEFFNYRNDNYNRWIKVRRLYGEKELHYNEDGYEYKMIFLNLELTRHYKFMLSKGYDI